MERYVARNYGPSRNIQFKGSFVFLERDKVLGTSDPELADVLRNTPEITVTERGDVLCGPPVVSPNLPEGPAPPEEPESAEPVGKEKELRATQTDDGSDEDGDGSDEGGDGEEDDEAEPIDYSALLVKDLQEIAIERDLEISGLLKAELIELLEEDDKTE